MVSVNTIQKRNNTGAFSASVVASIQDSKTLNKLLIEESVTNIDSVKWCINSVNSVSLWLYWKGDEEPFLMLSGNGNWNLTGISEIIRREGCDLCISCYGLEELDSFTLIITGKLKC